MGSVQAESTKDTEMHAWQPSEERGLLGCLIRSVVSYEVSGLKKERVESVSPVRTKLAFIKMPPQ